MTNDMETQETTIKSQATIIATLRSELKDSKAEVEKLKNTCFELKTRGHSAAMMYFIKDDINRTLHPMIDGYPRPANTQLVQAVRNREDKWIIDYIPNV